MYFKLRPLQKSVNLSNKERLQWLRDKFMKLQPEVQQQLFPLLKADLKVYLIEDGFKRKPKSVNLLAEKFPNN